MSSRPKFVIIDGNAILHRAWHALPPLQTKKGLIVNAVYGFTSILLKVLKEIKPQYIAVTWDLPGGTFRHELYKEYKATREKKPQELYDQIALIKDVLRTFNIASFEKKGFEADDLIGTLSHKDIIKNDGVDCLIVTGDLDTLQLVDEHTFVYTLKKGITDVFIYDQAAVRARYGLQPGQLLDYKALRGDASDNIPGVAGIGDKTATELLKDYGTLEKIYKAVADKSSGLPSKLADKLRVNKDDAFLSKKLGEIIRDVPLGFKLEATRLGKIDKDEVFKLFQELEFVSLLPKVQEVFKADQGQLFVTGTPSMTSVKPSAAPSNYVTVSTSAQLAEASKTLKKAGELSIATELFGNELSIAMATADKVYFFPSASSFASATPALNEILKKSVVGYDLKKDLRSLRKIQAAFTPVFDVLIAAYLINPGNRALTLEDLVFGELGVELTPLEKLLKENKSGVPQELATKYLCQRADYALKLKPLYEERLKKADLLKLFQEMEMPLVPILGRMEDFGVKLDSKFLAVMSKELAKNVNKISAQIYTLAGENFNISSPLQLKRILFEKLQIPVTRIKKTKTGLSTAAAELEKMRGLHPIIDLISQYRELTKLQSTYVDALPQLVDKKTDRIHTTFNQVVAATGRLSSSDPNLQNIPIKTEIGREIRKAFVAEKGYKILTGDYAQIELRIVAALAHDKNMMASFVKGEDIHRRTAAEVYGVQMEDVTSEMRMAAKTINFGVLYGQGPHALSQQTGMSFEEAREFIAKYFSIYSGVKDYMEETLKKAKKLGFVQTLFGRKRYLPELNSGVAVIRSAAERMANNMPIQGTEADLVKMSMLAIHENIYALNGNSQGEIVRMILQVHDELVFEVREDQVEKIGVQIKDLMENIYKLGVPLVAKISTGDNWGELIEKH